ncbi:MAG: hypothetical protein EOO73_27530 [Myxococcales bacterium]|nr:MAG: hypothetical protein EOO73_27530 [Myxococcales bacterium]
MQGDFTRNSDDWEAAYSGVLMQQGRVQLDADWNEQAAIQKRALRRALRDLIGPHAGPANEHGELGFLVEGTNQDATLTIGGGIYYVDGIRVVQRGGPATLSLAQQPDGAYVAFLDVWERHVNSLEDPRIREIALGGPDTATRTEVVSRVRLLRMVNTAPDIESPDPWADNLIAKHLRQRPRRRLAARAATASPNVDPCQLSPASQYRGRENQLYRVQIHDALPEGQTEPIRNKADRGKGKGKLAAVREPFDARGDAVLFTFKWSRDNGSVVFPIVRIAAPESPATAGDREIEITVELGSLGRDERFGLVAGDIVELVNDALTLETLDDVPLFEGGRDPGRPGLLGRVLAPIDRDDLTVRIAVFADDLAEIAEGTLHPYLRRWDHRPSAKRPLERGAIPVRQADLDRWLPLEDGVEVLFAGPPKEQGVQEAPEQRSGDYWQIPARVASGDVLWPSTGSGDPAVKTPLAIKPHGPHHHYAPLAIVLRGGTGIDHVIGVRRRLKPLFETE